MTFYVTFVRMIVLNNIRLVLLFSDGVFHTKPTTETKYIFRKQKLTILSNIFLAFGCLVTCRVANTEKRGELLALPRSSDIIYCFVFNDLLN
jgi:hypothetical protein